MQNGTRNIKICPLALKMKINKIIIIFAKRDKKHKNLSFGLKNEKMKKNGQSLRPHIGVFQLRCAKKHTKKRDEHTNLWNSGNNIKHAARLNYLMDQYHRTQTSMFHANIPEYR